MGIYDLIVLIFVIINFQIFVKFYQDDKPITQSMPQPSNPVPPPVFYQPQLLPQPQSLPQPEPYPVPSPIYNQPIQTQPQPQPLNPNDPFQTQQNFIIVQQPNMLTHTVFGKYPQTVTW
jgi:hypothetical protein